MDTRVLVVLRTSELKISSHYVWFFGRCTSLHASKCKQYKQCFQSISGGQIVSSRCQQRVLVVTMYHSTILLISLSTLRVL